MNEKGSKSSKGQNNSAASTEEEDKKSVFIQFYEKKLEKDADDRESFYRNRLISATDALKQGNLNHFR